MFARQGPDLGGRGRGRNCTALFLVTGNLAGGRDDRVREHDPEHERRGPGAGCAADRFGTLETSEEGALTGYGKYNSLLNNSGQKVYGDVIIYRPNGDTTVHPIIHRALEYVNDSVAAATYHASHGDISQKETTTRSRTRQGGLAGIGHIQPVKPEWVVGKVFFVVPLVGLLPLHLPEVVVVVVVLMLLYEVCSGRAGMNPGTRNERKESGDAERRELWIPMSYCMMSAGRRLTEAEGLHLLSIRGREIFKVARRPTRFVRSGSARPSPMSEIRTFT